MKRIVSIAVLTALVFCLVSCSNGKEEKETTDTESNPEVSVEIMNDKNATEAVSPELLLTYTAEDGEKVLSYQGTADASETGCIFHPLGEGVSDSFNPVSLPMGVTLGMEYEDVCRAFSLADGYGLFGKRNGTPSAYDSSYKYSIPEGSEGVLIVCYRIEDGDCILCNGALTGGLLQGNVNYNVSFDIIMFSMDFDDSGKLLSMFEIYNSYGMFLNMMGIKK